MESGEEMLAIKSGGDKESCDQGSLENEVCVLRRKFLVGGHVIC